MDKTKINYFISFLITAVTGIAISIFLPSGESRGGLHSTLFGYGRHDWGVIHDRAGIIMVIAVVIHILLHLKWIIAITQSFLKIKKNT